MDANLMQNPNVPVDWKNLIGQTVGHEGQLWQLTGYWPVDEYCILENEHWIKAVPANLVNPNPKQL